jgi:NAD(P)-dependent dehydrogenase (short-subunit alcohol dehydrogenase family)
VDTLFSHAGTIIVKPLHESTDDDYECLMNINVRSSFVVCREVVSHMLENGGGSIVITSSIGGEKGFGLESLYCMTKGAVLQLARSIAIEYRDKGIRANAVCPGFVKTAHGLREIDGLDGLGSMGLARTGTRRTCRACRDGSASRRKWPRPRCGWLQTRRASSTDWRSTSTTAGTPKVKTAAQEKQRERI